MGLADLEVMAPGATVEKADGVGAVLLPALAEPEVPPDPGLLAAAVPVELVALATPWVRQAPAAEVEELRMALAGLPDSLAPNAQNCDRVRRSH